MSYLTLSQRVAEEGESIQTPVGTYFCWSPSKGVELWIRAVPESEHTYLHPHFTGDARMRVAIVDRKEYEKNILAEGFFVAYPNPVKGKGFLSEQLCLQYGDGTYSNYFPFLFDAPDYDTYAEMELPFLADVQITAFPYTLRAYETEDDWIDWQLENDENAGDEDDDDRSVLSGEAFCPSTAFQERKDKDDYPNPTALIAGRILDSAILNNEATGEDFCWAKVLTKAGEIDIVASPALLDGYIVKDGILSCHCYLSGRIMHITDVDSLME
jgi:hypothetical protein